MNATTNHINRHESRSVRGGRVVFLLGCGSAALGLGLELCEFTKDFDQKRMVLLFAEAADVTNDECVGWHSQLGANVVRIMKGSKGCEIDSAVKDPPERFRFRSRAKESDIGLPAARYAERCMSLIQLGARSTS